MESKQRKANRTTEEIRATYEEKHAYHLMQAEAWALKIAKLEEPRKPRTRKASKTSLLKVAKDEFTRKN